MSITIEHNKKLLPHILVHIFDRSVLKIKNLHVSIHVGVPCMSTIFFLVHGTPCIQSSLLTLTACHVLIKV